MSVKYGNFVFVVEKKNNSFAQCYPFLYFYNRMNQPKVNFIILVEGDTFFPFCPFAHHLLEQQLKSYKFRIVYNIKVKRVDYLRRGLHCQLQNGT